MPNYERKLNKLAHRYAGSIARLASQSNLLTFPSPRQDRLFALACLESWANHLCKNFPIIHELPELRNYPLTWSDLREQLNFFSTQEFTVHPLDNKTINYGEKILLHSGANLHWQTNERVNNLYLYTPQGDNWSEIIFLKGRMLARTRRNFCANIANFDKVYNEIHREDLSSVRLWGTVQQFLDLTSQGLNLQPLPSNSRVFVFQDTLSPTDCNLRDGLAKLFNLPNERVHYFCADKDLQAIFFTCQCGYWHMPVVYRLCENLFYNPCVKHKPIIAKKIDCRLDYNCLCSCRLKAPVIEWNR